MSQNLGTIIPSEKLTEEVASALKKDFQKCRYQTLSSQKEVALRDYYNAINILDMKKDGVSGINNIQNKINKFSTSNGLYQFKVSREGSSRDGEGSLIATYYAASISSKLNDVSVADCTRRRLEEIWQNQSLEVESLGRAALVVAILHEVGYSVSDLNQYTNWKEMVNKRINAVLKVKPHLPAPILEHLNLILEHTTLQPSDLAIDLQEKLENAQLSDGGMNFMENADYSDPHGTSVFSSLSSKIDADIDTDSLRSFVQEHRMTSGGYLPTIISYPHFESTYYAIDLLALLEKSYHPAKIPDRIMANIEEIVGGFESLYKLLTILSEEVNILSTSDLRENIREYIISGNIELPELYYSLKLANKYDYAINSDEKEAILDFICKMHNESGGYGNKPTQRSTFFAVASLDIINKNNKIESSVVPWIRQSRINSSGYAYLESNSLVSEPNLLSTYYSIAILNIIEYNWKMKEDLKKFILDCRLDDGGFQTEPIESVPENRTLKATYFGIKSLQKILK
ncbi:prenyltransferase/squalene oxidase repeat-containing protein [Halorussus pelagicus]|uniref:prenyltransferase/squalene oxidase repeat-containing protein n=1 Tax=Halorussus pelagicus TaxID=2505977 RepID=UPI001407F4A5|nr:prenyltransferase/squalene oxidase repeat-containing protein [Halorussus pelagicus]